MKHVIRLTTLAITLLLLGAIAYAQQQPPEQVPLGDLVKQKATKKAKKVVTDDDMPTRPPEAATPAAATGEAESQAQAQDKDTQPKPPADKAAQEQERQAKIADLKDSEEAEKRVIKKMEDSLTEPTLSDMRRRMYEQTLRLSREQLAVFTKEREALEQGTAPKPAQAPTTPQ